MLNKKTAAPENRQRWRWYRVGAPEEDLSGSVLLRSSTRVGAPEEQGSVLLRTWLLRGRVGDSQEPPSPTFLAARLCIPMSLYAHLRHSLGFATARASIKLFQMHVVDNVILASETMTGGTHPTSRRPDPYSIADWRETSALRTLPDTSK